MEVSVRIPDKIKAHLKEPYDKYVNETLVVEMYREGLFTLVIFPNKATPKAANQSK